MSSSAPHAEFSTPEDAVAVVTINRADRLGAYTPQMCAELQEAIRRVRLDDDIRVLVLTGKGRGFCTGGDVSPDAGFADVLAHQIGRARELREDAHAVITALNQLDKPVICAVNGIAVNGGLAFALACDLRIVAASARLGDTSACAGLLPDEGGAWLFPRAMGYDNAFRMVALSEIYDAGEAQRLGLATEVVEDERLWPRTMELARQFRAAAPLAVRAVKFMMRRALENTLQTSLGDAQQAVLWVGPSADAKEGKAAFLERRPPSFTGH
ncbi:enoyl-CoA hydratase/isomerase family protein [Mycobacterium paraseoulense]|uniref:Enoyl-CoA hydratase n=1 Tax=Mycobacterium paraseoulense TaxID=590652 RepID=A0A1X0IF52_9MYCO|nr:enoyl-CoA hydratase/isomerase family protein [Mycobacterium paraseoulense]MCV7393713.1 enoyl-CoA hydratase/isomerase family protein [Mycobacterium paraseoulense]ORB45536.1 enoyl-CoA hydratase [Mycobacterium paraseoulense]BBZ70671.1 enoyl-CoA hydratase [Mycobacterium paraseoulense]